MLTATLLRRSGAFVLYFVLYIFFSFFFQGLTFGFMTDLGSGEGLP